MAKRSSSSKTVRRGKSTVKKKKPGRTTAAKKTSKKTGSSARRSTVAKKKKTSTGSTRSRKPSASTIQNRLKKIDAELIKLANQRAELTTTLIESAEHPDEVLYNPHADDELWSQLRQTNSGPLTEPALRGVFREILSSARQRVKRQRVVYLGPQFSFTHLAAIERFGKEADLIPVSTIASVFEEVNRGNADYGLVPIENSTDGRIVDTLDMFTRLPLRICGEVQISVHHNLLARCARGEITEVYSKPQALSQCREWLARNMPQARLIEVTSTSTAAQLARDKPGAAAVASRQAAVEYDLQIIAAHIEDNAHNITRFAVIGDEVTKRTGKDRTAILLQISHNPGSLTDALAPFKKNKINLTWIESFPLRGPESGYLFFMDFEGHIKEARIDRALKALERSAVRLEILGSYPRSEPL